MAVVCLDGFENGTVTTNMAVLGDGVQIGTGADGVGLSLGSDSTNIFTTGRHIIKTFTSASDTIYGHYAFLPYHWNGTTGGEEGVIFTIWSDARATLHLSGQFDSSGHFMLMRGDWNGTLLQTSTVAIPVITAWRSLQFKVRIHDTLGEVIIKLDGVTAINFTGDTRNGGTSTSPDGVGIRSKYGQAKWDDVVVYDTTGPYNNSWPGQVSIAGLRPIGNGALSALVGSDGNSTDNYALVDEVPASSADYVGSGVTGARDTYDVTTLTKVGTIVGVQSYVYAAKSDAGTRFFKHIRRTSGGSVDGSSAQPLSTTYLLYGGPIWETQADASAWTVAAVNSHEFGVEVA
jgi:hypothetical protein